MADLESLAVAALDGLLAAARPVADGLAWTAAPSSSALDPAVYSGTAGVVLALVEGHRTTGDRRYGAAAEGGARWLETVVDSWEHPSLYLGRAGIAVVLTAMGRPGVAARTIDGLFAAFGGERWGEQFELMGGNAGIALGALACGRPDLAASSPTCGMPSGLHRGAQWEGRIGQPGRPHHISHGTLGVVAALASVADATGRADLLDLALAGAADVVARNEAGPEGFLVPHSDPPYKPEFNPRWAYGWCHGPAGDAQVFRLLGRVTGDGEWARLAGRCWYTVSTSGLPRRSRPGFWDNSGRSTAALLLQWEVARRRAAVGGTTQLTATWWSWFEFALAGRTSGRVTLFGDGLS